MENKQQSVQVKDVDIDSTVKVTGEDSQEAKSRTHEADAGSKEMLNRATADANSEPLESA